MTTRHVVDPLDGQRRARLEAIGAIALALAVVLIVLDLLGTGSASAQGDRTAKAQPTRRVFAGVPTGGTVNLASGRTYHVTGDLAQGQPRPVLIVIGGLYHSAASTERQIPAAGYGTRHGVRVIYVEGVNRSWNAGGCCGFATTHKIDDLAYLTDVVADISRRLPVDRARVYLIGDSVGGMLSERAACVRSDIFAAAASVAGPLLTDCPGTAHILHIYGPGDTTVPYNGGYSTFVHYTFPSAEAVQRTVLNGHPGAVYGLLMLPTMGHGWPTIAHDRYGTDNIVDWLLTQRATPQAH